MSLFYRQTAWKQLTRLAPVMSNFCHPLTVQTRTCILSQGVQEHKHASVAFLQADGLETAHQASTAGLAQNPRLQGLLGSVVGRDS